jgi:hypothetical protein
MNVAGSIASLATGTYTVTRTAAGDFGGGFPISLGGGLASNEDGRYRPGTSSTFTISASVQPARGRDLLRLPEGQRTREVIAIFTATALQTAAAPGGATADAITFQGSQYEVQTVEYWFQAGGFYKALALKVQA